MPVSIDEHVPTTLLDEASEALEELATVLADDQPLEDVLQQLAESAARVIPDAENVGVTVLTPEGPITAAATDRKVVEVDADQYAAGDGPCLEAARQRRPVRVSVDVGRVRWPEFAAAAERAGVRAYLSAPLVLKEEDVLGALNIYSSEEHAFDPFDEALLKLFVTAACTAITGFRRYERSRALVEHLQRALVSRAEIDQAKGVLMGAYGITADEAFTRLVGESQQHNTKLREVARNLLGSVRRP
ncbi:ANTAR domain-containing response regulator [Saccharothrix syringae]|uniref:ANTAR domain-containing protein n=1 Tax=Saccharothrix syringae TaxID=103733 RepID=A0A5Q0H6R3_SACSY|nr:GAF and ANTAR domain-containing protein [Saccharothrix syringae]QFZ21849.1 ANTAR domain-containing protein [Saccharothrix syringae]